MAFFRILPMAFVMIAGPQILSAVFLATGEGWRRNSAAFVSGAAIAITLFVTLAYAFSNGASNSGTSDNALYVVVLVLLVAAAIHTFVKRRESQPPKWMGRLQSATPKFSFTLGFLLLGIFPSDILTSVAMGTYVAAHNEPWWHTLGFVAVTVLLLSAPVLLVIALGERGQTILPRFRRLDEQQLVDRERARARALHRPDGQRPGGLTE